MTIVLKKESLTSFPSLPGTDPMPGRNTFTNSTTCCGGQAQWLINALLGTSSLEFLSELSLCLQRPYQKDSF